MDLSRKVIILIYGRAFSFLLSLLIPLALTRLLLKEDYGSYQQLVMIYTIVQAILLFGMQLNKSREIIHVNSHIIILSINF